jgi:3-dehydroquinate synthase
MLVAPIATVSNETRATYHVYLKRGCLFDLPDKICNFGDVNHALLISDDTVYKLYGSELERRVSQAGIRVTRFIFEPRRKKKSLRTAAEIFRLLFANAADRNTVVLNVGGGTVGDLGGFVAALYLRGVRYIHVPTTLLSQADSGVGGKVNVNFGVHLNSLSVFYHPAAVWIDPDVLSTLPAREYLSGVGEIVKYAVVLDAELFAMLEENRTHLARPGNELIDEVVLRCLERKCQIVSQDPKETGLFRFFNYGHEIGHAVEVAYDYEHLLHGEAISIGSVAASWMGVQMSLTDPEVLNRQCALLTALGLPTTIPHHLRKKYPVATLERRIRSLLAKDKKRVPKGTVWIIPERIGSGICTTQISPEKLTACCRKLAEGDWSS